jgi:branched-chain amino acid transport system substrate-binding protein
MVRSGLWFVGVIFAAALFATGARAEIRIGVAGPMTGTNAWFGEQYQRGTELAVEDLNARGGVLGERVELIVGDDFCDADQAVALAHKLASDGVVFVAGHWCSHTSIAASDVYEAAGVVMISPASTNPRLTERGLRYVFRTCGRDDAQGTLVADYLAEKWSGAAIAVVHDGQAYGQGIAEEAVRRLGELGIETALLEQVQPGQIEFSDLVNALEARGVDVVFYGGYTAEAGLIVRRAKARLPELAFVMPDGVGSADFWLIAGAAAEGIPMTSYMAASRQPPAADVVAAFRAAGTDPIGAELYAYAAVQAWAQAVEQAGTTDAAEVAALLHREQFDTVLGRIGFDDKGDVTGFEPWGWYVWQADGTYVPLEQDVANE